jgi:hypothetical protein
MKAAATIILAILFGAVVMAALMVETYAKPAGRLFFRP